MRYRLGSPPCEQDEPQFKYKYVDIHKRFFRKISDGSDSKFISQREMSVAEKFSAKKVPGVARIFIVGGSVAWDYSSYDFKSHIKKVFPGEGF